MTSYVKKVAAGTVQNYGMVLRNITSSPSYSSFYGSRSSVTGYRPKLAVTYYSKPTTATSVSISPSYVKKGSDAKITFKGITSTGLARYEYRLYKYSHSTGESTVYTSYSSSNTITSGATLPITADGCYKVAVRGVNKAGTPGAGKASNIVHIDSKAPALGTVTLPSSTEEKPGASSPVIKWSGVSDTHLKEVSLSLDGGQTYKKIGTTAAGSYTIPKSSFSRTGYYNIRFKAVDSLGNSSVKSFDNYYVCIDGPDIKRLKLETASGDFLKPDEWTSDNAPKVIFDNLTDKKAVIKAA